DAALADPRLDADRVGVLGGSYGGYITPMLTPPTDRFAAADVERGLPAPASFAGSGGPRWYFCGGHVGGRGGQGAARRPRGQLEQGQRWYVGLKQRGVPAELLLFPGEGHELSRSGTPKHRIARFEHILAWWQRHLPVS